MSRVFVLGIVGHEAAKFTPRTEAQARVEIRRLMAQFVPTLVVSGACHLGGIDIWTIEEARALGLATEEYPPKTQSWFYGYKPRNIQIAENSDAVACIVVREYPPAYQGKKFPICYHCGSKAHVKSGGCWTVKYARGLQRQTRIIEI